MAALMEHPCPYDGVRHEIGSGQYHECKRRWDREQVAQAAGPGLAGPPPGHAGAGEASHGVIGVLPDDPGEAGFDAWEESADERNQRRLERNIDVQYRMVQDLERRLADPGISPEDYRANDERLTRISRTMYADVAELNQIRGESAVRLSGDRKENLSVPPTEQAYFDQNGQGQYVQRQPIRIDESGEFDDSLTEQNAEVIDSIAEEDLLPMHPQATVDPESGRYLVNTRDSRVMAPTGPRLDQSMVLLSETGHIIGRYTAGSGTGRHVGLIHESADGPKIEYIGSPEDADDLVQMTRDAGEQWAREVEQDPSAGKELVPCDYCGKRHRRRSAIFTDHQARMILTQENHERGPESALAKRRALTDAVRDDMTDRYEAESGHQAPVTRDADLAWSDEQRQRAEDDQRGSVYQPGPPEDKQMPVADETQATPTEQIARVPASENPAPTPVSEPTGRYTDPRRFPPHPVGHVAQSGNMYQLPSDQDSAEAPRYAAHNPTWVTPSYTRGSPDHGLPAPALPQNIGSVHVPSLVASIGGFGSDAMISGDYLMHGDPYARTSRHERKAAINAAAEWAVHQEMWLQGIRPGTGQARQWLSRNQDMVNHYRMRAAASMGAAERARALHRLHPDKYPVGGTALRRVYAEALSKREHDRQAFDGRKPMRVTDMARQTLQAGRVEGVGGAARYLGMWARNRARAAKVRGLGMAGITGNRRLRR